MIKTHCRLKLSVILNSECKKTHNNTYNRTYHTAITVFLALTSIMTSIFRGQDYFHLAPFLLNHLTSMNRSNLNQNYETLYLENIVTYMTSIDLHQTSNKPPILEVVTIKTHRRLKLNAKLNS